MRKVGMDQHEGCKDEEAVDRTGALTTLLYLGVGDLWEGLDKGRMCPTLAFKGSPGCELKDFCHHRLLYVWTQPSLN